jgi:hypothetical protein
MTNMQTYREHVDAVLRRQQTRTAEAQDIGEIPECVDPDRRKRAAESFDLFCRTYAPRTFYLPWAPFHLSAAAKIERAARQGGRFAFAMPRAQGKSSLCEWAAIWAVLNGLRLYVVLVGATQADAEKRLENIKTELDSNDLLLDDFPECCYPIRKLERSTRRCQGQKFRGRPTGIQWGQDCIRLANIPGAPGGGAIIESAGITGRIRGRVQKLDDGRSLRPSLAIVDDPQTRESAKSETQSRDREATIAGDVSYMGGPDTPMAVVLPCTVIYRDDLADRLLNRMAHPEWQGERTKMVLSWPTNEAMWAQYHEIWSNDLRNDGDGTAGTRFYQQHQAEMDAGAEVSWPERTGGMTSAIEHVMLLRMQDEAAFMAEYQNEPMDQIAIDAIVATPHHISQNINGMDRGIVPLDGSVVTAGVDVQQSLLYWVVAAWRQDFSGYVLDYGTWPPQDRRDFTLQTARQTLDLAYPNAGLEGRLYAGLQALAERILLVRWARDADGAELPVERAIIDANWAQSTQLVYQFCRELQVSGAYPGHGKGIGASGTPWSEYVQRPGERLGHHWRVPPLKRSRPTRHVLYDTNYWKSFIHARWVTAIGDPASLTLYGRRDNHAVSMMEHVNFAGQQCAEYPVRTEGRGRTVDEWRLKPHRPDNHWFDALVAAAVAASMAGVSMVGAQSPRIPVANLPRITRDYLQACGRL